MKPPKDINTHSLTTKLNIDNGYVAIRDSDDDLVVFHYLKDIIKLRNWLTSVIEYMERGKHGK